MLYIGKPIGFDGKSYTLFAWLVWWSGWYGKAYDFFVCKADKWPWKPIILKSCVIPKHRFCLWLLAHGKLLTKDRQSYIIDKICVLCSCVDESASHLFFKCTVSSQIWNKFREWLGIHKLMGGASAVLRAFRGVYRGGSMVAKQRVNALAAKVYLIWNARNRAIFDGESASLEAIVRRIQILVLRNAAMEAGHARAP